jgi:hypothetical protein
LAEPDFRAGPPFEQTRPSRRDSLCQILSSILGVLSHRSSSVCTNCGVAETTSRQILLGRPEGFAFRFTDATTLRLPHPGQQPLRLCERAALPENSLIDATDVVHQGSVAFEPGLVELVLPALQLAEKALHVDRIRPTRLVAAGDARDSRASVAREL